MRRGALLWLASLAACGGTEPVALAPAPPAPAEQAAAARGTASVGGDVVATVDGEPITLGEIEELSRTGGITALEALRRLEAERVLERLAASSPAAADPAVERAARRAAVRALLARDVEAGREPETVSAADLEARRVEIAAGLSAPETRRASHALIPLSDGASEAQVEAAFRLARRIRDEVRSSETPSAALDGYAGPQGGLEVTVEHMDPLRREDVVAPFADALFSAAEPGLIGEPVRTSYGVHVIVLEEIVPPWEVPREEWEAVLRRQIAAERRALALEELAGRLAADTSIVIDPGVARLAETVPLARGPRSSGEAN